MVSHFTCQFTSHQVDFFLVQMTQNQLEASTLIRFHLKMSANENCKFIVDYFFITNNKSKKEKFMNSQNGWNGVRWSVKDANWMHNQNCNLEHKFHVSMWEMEAKKRGGICEVWLLALIWVRLVINRFNLA